MSALYCAQWTKERPGRRVSCHSKLGVTCRGVASVKYVVILLFPWDATDSYQRLAIDPNKNSILYFGARSGHGLWKSTDYGVTWTNVTSFKWPGESRSSFISGYL